MKNILSLRLFILIFINTAVISSACSTNIQTPTPTIVPTGVTTSLPTPLPSYPYPAPTTEEMVSSYPSLEPSAPAITAVLRPTPTSVALTVITNQLCTTASPSDWITVEISERAGWCKLSVPLTDYKTIGYSLNYPETWLVRLAGAEHMNLVFNEGIDREVFLGLTWLANPSIELGNTDKASYGFEMSEAKPLVDPNEFVVNKEIKIISDKWVLFLETKTNDFIVKRYFLLREDDSFQTVYMYKVNLPTTDFTEEEQSELLAIVEEIIASMEFAR